MLTPGQIEVGLQQILSNVQKPGRYVGGEYNSIVKDWNAVDLHVALVFPDIYDIGISNVGLKILYDQVNQRSDALAERAYSPWFDMEAQMRQVGLPLYSLESKHPLGGFDLLGFSLPYETLYTNTLNILDLAGIPVRSEERTEAHPLVIAGGHSTMNPEPMHAFMDAFVVGEGEEAIHDVLNAMQAHRRHGGTRQSLLRSLARIPGVYVPQFYQATYSDDGTVARVRPMEDGVPATITKRIVAQLPPPPIRFLVPNIETVHNRVSVEIMRGCTRGCRFCQAGMITRPVRERTVEEIVEAAEKALAATGFEELAFLSLSSSDFGSIQRLVDEVGDRLRGTQLTISLPSLRIETVSIDLMEKLKEHRSAGFTLAPEAATERMRRIINKSIPDSEIIETAREIYRRGWTTLKLYFMIGHPSERVEDVQAIAHLCKRVLAAGREVIGWKAKLHAGVGTFVPKPHTPFQWVASESRESVRKKQALLRRELGKEKNIKLSWTDPEASMLEAWLTRGDRRMAEVIQKAWETGSRFDAWEEGFNPGAWARAFEACGLDPAFYTQRQRRTDEVFPWDHISAAVRKNFLFQDFRMSLEGEIRVDCRMNCFACGILPTFAGLRREHPGEGWKCPDMKSPARLRNTGLVPGSAVAS